MIRLPNNQYYPNFDNEDYTLSHDEVALNPELDNTPFLISSQIATKTKEYADNKPISQELLDMVNIDWMADYRDGLSYFVPENRWTHEVVTPPIEIDKDLYLIKLSADVYFRSNQMPIDDEMQLNSFNFVSRTLYPYVQEFDGNATIDDDSYATKAFGWIIRWLPNDNKSLIFYTTEDIEQNLLIKTPKYKVDISNANENVVVPFFLHKSLGSKMSSFKHDSDILYMKVVDNEKE
jgi:hypothetical protein